MGPKWDIFSLERFVLFGMTSDFSSVCVTLSVPTILLMTQKMLVGYKKGFGILCSCCDTVVRSR